MCMYNNYQLLISCMISTGIEYKSDQCMECMESHIHISVVDGKDSP